MKMRIESRTQEQINNQQEFLRNILESLTYPCFVINPEDYTIRMANSAADNGRSFEGMKCYQLFHRQDYPCSRSGYICLIEEVKKKKKAVILEHKHYSSDGEPVYVEVHGYPVFDEQERITDIIEYQLNTTEHKRFEEELQNSKDRAEMIFHLVPNPVLTIDSNHIITSVNERFCQVTGYSSDEVIGKKCTQYFLEPCSENCAFLAGQSSESVIGEECGMRTRDGKILTVSKNAVLLRDEKGQITGAILSFEDITETHNAEGKREQLVRELESVNRELRDFAYIISHDLKAPLRGIATLAEWISSDYSDKFDEQGKEQLQLLLSRVKKMHNMIDGVLQYSRVGRIKEDKQSINLNEIVSEISDIINPPANIQIEVVKELPVIEFEPTRIKQVFQNLLSNAVKFIDKPQGYIKISYEDEGEFLKFSIEDNGCGISREHYERIFQIFQTVGLSGKSESTGVGLTVVKKIVELYGGKIWVSSSLGQGSTFYFTLPKSEVGEKSGEKFKAYIAG